MISGLTCKVTWKTVSPLWGDSAGTVTNVHKPFDCVIKTYIFDYVQLDEELKDEVNNQWLESIRNQPYSNIIFNFNKYE